MPMAKPPSIAPGIERSAQHRGHEGLDAQEIAGRGLDLRDIAAVEDRADAGERGADGER
jgi:hypothetical protein